MTYPQIISATTAPAPPSRLSLAIEFAVRGKNCGISKTDDLTDFFQVTQTHESIRAVDLCHCPPRYRPASGRGAFNTYESYGGFAKDSSKRSRSEYAPEQFAAASSHDGDSCAASAIEKDKFRQLSRLKTEAVRRPVLRADAKEACDERIDFDEVSRPPCRRG